MNTYDGCKYFTIFVDEYTKYKWVYLHQDRTESVEILKRWILDATKGSRNKVQCIRLDQAGEHMSKEYYDELKAQKIQLETSNGYDHWQNGVAEKAIRDVCNMARCMLEYGRVARDMWGYAVRYAVHVQNRIVHRGMYMSPYEMRHGEAADLDRLKVFGCTAYVARDKKETDFVKDQKFDTRGAEGCFMGMADDGVEVHGGAVKGYVVWTLETGARVITSEQVSFDETRYPRLMGVTEWEFSLKTKVEKCKATITVMSFDTEHVDRHPFVFEQDELKYRTEQTRTKLDPFKLIGMDIIINHEGQQRKGKIYNYLPEYKVWGIVLSQSQEHEPSLIYVTAAQMAREEKVIFRDKLQVFKRDIAKGECIEGPITDLNEISLFNMQLKSDIDMLRYDSSCRSTDTITRKAVRLNVMKNKAPITRHEPEPKGWKQVMESPHAKEWYKASEAEIRGLEDMKTWEVTRPIPGVKPIDSKWVYKVKYTPTCEVEK